MSSRLPSIYHTLTPPRNYNLENLEFLSRISLSIPRSAPIPLFHTKRRLNSSFLPESRQPSQPGLIHQHCPAFPLRRASFPPLTEEISGFSPFFSVFPPEYQTGKGHRFGELPYFVLSVSVMASSYTIQRSCHAPSVTNKPIKYCQKIDNASRKPWMRSLLDRRSMLSMKKPIHFFIVLPYLSQDTKFRRLCPNA